MFTLKNKLTEIKTQLEQSKTENASLRLQVEQSNKAEVVPVAKLNELQAQFDEYKKVSVPTAQFTELEAKYKTLSEEVSALETEVTTAENKSIEIAASQGIPAPSVKPKTDLSLVDTNDVLAGYTKLSGNSAAQRKYWDENREELVKLIYHTK